MGLDNIFLIVIRLVMAIFTGLMAFFLLFTEKFMELVKKATGKPASSAPVVKTPTGVSAGVPARVTPPTAPAPAAAAVVAPVSPTAVSEPLPVAAPAPAPAAPAAVATPAIDPDLAPGEPDDLDWAGSLNHAAAAAALIGDVLDQLEAGRFVIPTEHEAQLLPLAERLAAFEDRTRSTLAPLIDGMNELEQQDFMADFAVYFDPNPDAG